MTGDQERRIAELTEAAEAITASIDKLNTETGGQLVSLSYRARRNRRMIWLLAFSLFLDIVLTFFVVHLTAQVDRAERLTHSQVLCPLYQQFVNADTPKARAFAQKTGQDMKARDEAFGVIHRSYRVLRCSGEK